MAFSAKELYGLIQRENVQEGEERDFEALDPSMLARGGGTSKETVTKIQRGKPGSSSH